MYYRKTKQTKVYILININIKGKGKLRTYSISLNVDFFFFFFFFEHIFSYPDNQCIVNTLNKTKKNYGLPLLRPLQIYMHNCKQDEFDTLPLFVNKI